MEEACPGTQSPNHPQVPVQGSCPPVLIPVLGHKSPPGHTLPAHNLSSGHTCAESDQHCVTLSGIFHLQVQISWLSWITERYTHTEPAASWLEPGPTKRFRYPGQSRRHFWLGNQSQILWTYLEFSHLWKLNPFPLRHLPVLRLQEHTSC